jgi:hypothetical protein
VLPPLFALLLVSCAPPEEPDAVDPAPDAPVVGDPIERLDVSAPVIEVQDVEREGGLAWACSNSDGLVSLDVSDPDALEVLAQWNEASPRCDRLALDGDRIYTVSRPLNDGGQGWMAAVDGADAAHPSLIEQVFADYDPAGIAAHRGELLIAAGVDGLVVADSGPGWPERGRVPTARARQVRAAGDHAWIADAEEGLIGVDLGSLSRVATLPLPGRPNDLDLLDGRAAVALGGGGVALVDVSTPSEPILLDVVDTPGSALAVAQAGDLLWVSDWLDLRLFRVDGERLAFVGRESLPLGTVPPPVDPNLPNFSLGVVAWDDLVLSADWTEFATFRARPERVAGDLVAAPTLLRLPRAEVGEISRAAFVLRNEGSAPLTVDGASASDGFTVEQDLPLTLAPGAVEGVTVRFAPTSGGPQRGEIVLRSDDVDEPELRTTVLANDAGLSVGDAVPDLSFLGLDGAPVRLADRLDGPVLLAYFATF